MADSSPLSGSPSVPSEASASSPAQHIWHDSMLRIAFLAALLLLAYQLAVTLLQPAWSGPVTDWLLMLVAWSGLLVMVLVSSWFTRREPRQARPLWLASAGVLSYALANTLWLVENQIFFPNHVPEPFWHDFFFALQYPCFFLALLLVPRVRPRMHTALVVLDACLLLGAAFALSWYFLLAPIYQSSHETVLGKLVNLIYPVGDLAIFIGLTMIWLHYREYALNIAIMALLIAASLCLLVADTWYALIRLNTSSYQVGSPPDLFFLAFYLLLPLMGLVRFRLAQRTLAGVSVEQIREPPQHLRRQDLIAGLRVTSPVATAVLASTLLLIHANQGTSTLHPLAPPLIALGLLGLALVRQCLTAVENERLHRAREEALRATTTQIETFLGIVGHELKNPLANMQLGLQLVERRLRRLLQRERVERPDVATLLEPVVQAEHQEERMNRLVSDLVDVSRVRAGKLDLHLALTNLAAIVLAAVEEQRQVHPKRTIHLECPQELWVPVMADAYRLGQVVTNYLTNALKYSAADRPVAVGLQADDQQTRVWVRDAGPGLPAEEHERIWEPFHRAKGIQVQCGDGGGLGLGLHVCRTIIQLHHGQVGVQSTRGTGSTFWFTVPLASPEPTLERSQTDTPEG